MKTFSRGGRGAGSATAAKQGERRGDKRGRKPTGQLIWRSSGWSARLMAVVDGERVRVCRPLGTDNKAVARLKLARLLEAEGTLSNEAAARAETFEEAAERVVKGQQADGLSTWTDRLQRLKQFAFPEFGHVPVTDVRPTHVRSALARALAAGKSRSTITKVKIDVSTVLAELWRDEMLPENVAERVQVPKNAPVDRRERVVLTDAEFEAFMACPNVGAELHTMALVSRTLGGARTSDLHAWDWAHVDTVGWGDAHVPRPKTKSGHRMLLPDVLVPVLRAWWDSHGRPTAGPVFPCRRGARAGQRKGKGISYASALREALWAAKVVRPLPGFDRAATDAERRKLCLIQAGSTEHRPLDFHSFRRAYNTALADANVNVQTAMRLAGHRNASTHMRYVMRAGSLATPTAALPVLAQLGTGRARKPQTSVVVDAEAQSANGTPTDSQSAVFSPSLELASDRELQELSVGHEGLEPSTNGLRIHCSTN
jgi:integrase